MAEPLMVSAREAATLCGIGLPLFKSLVRSGAAPPPVRISKQKRVWQKRLIVEWIEADCPIWSEWKQRKKVKR